MERPSSSCSYSGTAHWKRHRFFSVIFNYDQWENLQNPVKDAEAIVGDNGQSCECYYQNTVALVWEETGFTGTGQDQMVLVLI